MATGATREAPATIAKLIKSAKQQCLGDELDDESSETFLRIFLKIFGGCFKSLVDLGSRNAWQLVATREATNDHSQAFQITK